MGWGIQARTVRQVRYEGPGIRRRGLGQMRAAKTAPMAAAAAATAGTPVGPAPLEELDGDGNAETGFDGRTVGAGAVELATVESEPETVAVEALGLVLTPTVMVLTPTVVALDFLAAELVAVDLDALDLAAEVPTLVPELLVLVAVEE